MDPLEIIKKYYKIESMAFKILVNHSKAVAEKALKIAEKFEVDKQFIYESAVLHDIGIFMTNTAKFDCHGIFPYICHGYLGREILEKEGFPRHALVCERHTGVGITKEEIIKNNLPLPHRDMIPLSMEEKIIAFADKFFSKESDGSVRLRTVDEIINDLARYGEEKVKIFKEWLKLFEGNA
ncbi:MAG: HDIG domain-containing protein [Thermodesulfovibrio sp.]|uniref:HD domain-containing protein n=1 Tax=unclassified Thermodesulfovibrio TaxID=2645936 RepID=UPI00083B59F7|nr:MULTISPECIES: HD domain-containing protein [unclassified Thermodesulfovibrio]MDI1472206.1 HDIG domain-containing protein [Thermodesulfovibrio sp. 1176]MDI6714069.1 HDIG domain-containing protein [Thermodesulfovibrio sp.]ODA43856.1 HDIG domain protein [Thermodesulfovibrio sp. N1]